MLLDFNALAQKCAPDIHPTTLRAVVSEESSGNPFAIGVVGGRLVRQPKNLPEAVATAKSLSARKINFSMGLAQVNQVNLAPQGLDFESVFDPCRNLSAGAAILLDCYARASKAKGKGSAAMPATLSCYYSGNFTTGLKPDFRGTSYVQRVYAKADAPAAGANAPSTANVPAIEVVMNDSHKKPSASGKESPKSASATPPETLSQDAKAKRATWDAFGDFSRD